MQEKVGDSVAQSTDTSSPAREEDEPHPTSPSAKSPQNKLPPPKPEPLATAAGDQGDQETTGEGMYGASLLEISIVHFRSD